MKRFTLTCLSALYLAVGILSVAHKSSEAQPAVNRAAVAQAKKGAYFNSYSHCANQDGRDGYIRYEVDSFKGTNPNFLDITLVHPKGHIGVYMTDVKAKYADGRFFVKHLNSTIAHVKACGTDQGKFDPAIDLTHSVIHPYSELVKLNTH